MVTDGSPDPDRGRRGDPIMGWSCSGGLSGLVI